MGKGILTEPIERLLKDTHQDVTWAEPIPGVIELKKKMNNMSIPTTIEGVITVRFTDSVSRAKLSSLLGECEHIVDGAEGELTRNGYKPSAHHIERQLVGGGMQSIITFTEYGANTTIHLEGDKYTVEQRALEILEAYLQAAQKK